ncbi:MAG: hypothetical protein ABMA00_18020 [Gemmatimonas sp.]
MPTAPSRIRWNILPLIVSAGFVAYFLRSNMSVAGEARRGPLTQITSMAARAFGG